MRRIFQLVTTLGASAVLLTSCGKKTEETKPVRRDITETVFAPGELEAEGMYSLTAQVDGYLAGVDFEEGDTVVAGQLLARIDNRENVFNTRSAEALNLIAAGNTAPAAPALEQARNTIVTARHRMALDSVNAARYKRLLEANSVSRLDYENAALQYVSSRKSYESALEAYRQTQIAARQAAISAGAQEQVSRTLEAYNNLRAVVGGKVYTKLKQRGDFVRKGDMIATIGSSMRLYAKVSVDETNIARVRVGQEAVVVLNTDRSRSYKGRVVEIYPRFDEATQSFFCKIVVDEPFDLPVSGTQLQCNIVVARHENALLIPRAYLDYSGSVRVKGSDALRKVRTGAVGAEWVQVISGVDDQTTLVTENISANNMETSQVGESMR